MKNDQKRLKWLIAAGIFMRILYMLYTPVDVRSHDLWKFQMDSYGHAAYILNLLDGHLPQSNTVQFYQQPFYYLLSAGLARFVRIFLPVLNEYWCVSLSKIVSCMASCGTLILAVKTGKLLKLENCGLEILVLYVAFTPAFYLAGGSCGPDALAAFFITAEFLWTLYWKEKPDWKNTIILAFFYGFGIMTKISCAVIAFYTAFIFLEKLWNNRAEQKWVSLLKKYICFGMISFPLGLWYSIRNYIRFHQTFGYVPDIGREAKLYTGDHSLYARFLYLDINNLLKSPYASAWNDYNMPVYLLKSSLFGEFSFESPQWIPALLTYTASGIAIFLVLAIIWNVKNQITGYGKDLLIISALFFGSFLFFNIKYPYGCSMDFRYIVFLTIPAGIFMGHYEEQLYKKRRCYAAVKILFWSYAALSILMYFAAA